MPGLSMRADPLLHFGGIRGWWGNPWELVEVSSVLDSFSLAAWKASRGVFRRDKFQIST